MVETFPRKGEAKKKESTLKINFKETKQFSVPLYLLGGSQKLYTRTGGMVRNAAALGERSQHVLVLPSHL